MRFTAFAAVFLANAIVVVTAAYADDWPQWRGPKRDGVWRETGIVETLPADQIPLVWKVPVGPGYSGPTVAGDLVYVTDRVSSPEQGERVLCVNAKTGEKVWDYPYPRRYEISYPAGPRACVTIQDGLAFALGAMGDMHCFEAKTGELVWKRDLLADYEIKMPIWGISAAPLVDGDQVILHIGGKGACIVSLEKKTGKELWKALNDRASYSAPIMIQQAGQKVLLCWTGDHVAALNPKDGEVHWKHEFKPKNMVIGISTPVLEGDKVFVTSFYDGSLMLKLAGDKLAAEQVWRKRGADEQHTEALHSIIATPVMLGDHVYGVDSYGELRCLDANTGERIWEDRTATPRERWSNIHTVQNGDRFFMLNDVGELLIAKLSPKGFEEISRSKLLEPTTAQLSRRGGSGVTWSHPAYAHKHVFARSDEVLVCASLAKE